MTNRSRDDRVRSTAARLDALLSEAARDQRVPAALAMAVAPSINFGWQAALPGPKCLPGQAPDIGAPFRIASITKLFVAATIIRLVEAGKLSLEQPAADGLSHATARLLQAGGRDPGLFTIDQLLTHTSGLPDHASLPEYARAVENDPQHAWTRAEQVEWALKHQTAPASPGLQARYSDTGYVLLGEIIEQVTQLPLGTAVRQTLDFRKLGLQQTWWEGDEPVPAGLRPMLPQWMGESNATGFDPSFDRFGGGGIVSTLGDLVRFTTGLFRGAVFQRTATVSAACVVPPSSREPGSALHSRLAMLLPMGRSWAWGHLGFWGCGVAHCPSLDITVAATINQPYPVDVSWRTELVSRIGAIVAELALEEVR